MITQPPRYYRRKLPHIQPEEVVFAVNYRLAGSLPTSTIIRLQNERNETLAEITKRETYLLKQNRGTLPLNLLAEFERLRYQAKNQYAGKFNEI